MKLDGVDWHPVGFCQNPSNSQNTLGLYWAEILIQIELFLSYKSLSVGSSNKRHCFVASNCLVTENGADCAVWFLMGTGGKHLSSWKKNMGVRAHHTSPVNINPILRRKLCRQTVHRASASQGMCWTAASLGIYYSWWIQTWDSIIIVLFLVKLAMHYLNVRNPQEGQPRFLLPPCSRSGLRSGTAPPWPPRGLPGLPRPQPRLLTPSSPSAVGKEKSEPAGNNPGLWGSSGSRCTGFSFIQVFTHGLLHRCWRVGSSGGVKKRFSASFLLREEFDPQQHQRSLNLPQAAFYTPPRKSTAQVDPETACLQKQRG